MSHRSTTYFLLILWFQLRIREMTDVHQRSKMDSSLFFLCFQNDLLSVFLLWSFAMPATFRASPTPYPLLLLHPEFSSLGA